MRFLRNFAQFCAKRKKYDIISGVIPGSSMVEQEAVNFEVTGSSPVRGANLKFLRIWRLQTGITQVFITKQKLLHSLVACAIIRVYLGIPTILLVARLGEHFCLRLLIEVKETCFYLIEVGFWHLAHLAV